MPIIGQTPGRCLQSCCNRWRFQKYNLHCLFFWFISKDIMILGLGDMDGKIYSNICRQYPDTLYMLIFENLLQSSSLMLELGKRIEHYSCCCCCFFLITFALRCDSIDGMTITTYKKIKTILFWSIIISNVDKMSKWAKASITTSRTIW